MHPSPGERNKCCNLLLAGDSEHITLRGEGARFLLGQGVFVDTDGYVCEGPAMNIAFILANGMLVVPPFDKTLAGVTIRRVMEELPKVRSPGSHVVIWCLFCPLRPFPVDFGPCACFSTVLSKPLSCLVVWPPVSALSFSFSSRWIVLCHLHVLPCIISLYSLVACLCNASVSSCWFPCLDAFHCPFGISLLSADSGDAATSCHHASPPHVTLPLPGT